MCGSPLLFSATLAPHRCRSLRAIAPALKRFVFVPEGVCDEVVYAKMTPGLEGAQWTVRLETQRAVETLRARFVLVFCTVTTAAVLRAA